MKILSVLIGAVTLSACAAESPEGQIMQRSKSDSAAYCSERSEEGCEFSIVRTPEGWGVMAHPIVRRENGERGYVPGLWRSYSYDKDGKLLREMPGL